VCIGDAVSGTMPGESWGRNSAALKRRASIVSRGPRDENQLVPEKGGGGSTQAIRWVRKGGQNREKVVTSGTGPNASQKKRPWLRVMSCIRARRYRGKAPEKEATNGGGGEPALAILHPTARWGKKKGADRAGR